MEDERNLQLCPNQTYGVLIPADELLKRVKYQWFAVMSSQEILQTNMAVTKYLLLSLADTSNENTTQFINPSSSVIAI